jgi:hypothetical protein
VPVSLIGAFVFMQLFGLTDQPDHAVRAGAGHRHRRRQRDRGGRGGARQDGGGPLSPVRRGEEVLGEISGAIIAITLLMTAVFVPVAFMTGPVGVFYRQFSITMASSIVLSGVVALTLTPVLCAMILKNTPRRNPEAALGSRLIDGSTAAFERLTGCYVALLQRIVPMRRILTFGSRRFSCRSRHLRGHGRSCPRVHPQRGPGASSTRSSRRRRAPRSSARTRCRGACRRSRRRSRGRVGLVARRLRDPHRGPRLQRRHLPHRPQALVGARHSCTRSSRSSRRSRRTSAP